MLKTPRIKKQRDVKAIGIKESMSNCNESFSDANITGIKDNVKTGNQQMPFEILLQIMRAYSNFLASGPIKSKSI